MKRTSFIAIMHKQFICVLFLFLAVNLISVQKVNIISLRNSNSKQCYRKTEEYRFDETIRRIALGRESVNNSGDLVMAIHKIKELKELQEHNIGKRLYLFGENSNLISVRDFPADINVIASKRGTYIGTVKNEWKDDYNNPESSVGDIYKIENYSMKKVISNSNSLTNLELYDSGFALTKDSIFNIDNGQKFQGLRKAILDIDHSYEAYVDIKSIDNNFVLEVLVDENQQVIEKFNGNVGIDYLSLLGEVTRSIELPIQYLHTHKKSSSGKSHFFSGLDERNKKYHSYIFDNNGNQTFHQPIYYTSFNFSVSEDIAVANTFTRSFVLDLKTGKAIYELPLGNYAVSDHNAGIAVEIWNETVYIYDLKNSKLLFKDYLNIETKKWELFTQCIQISGDGREVSVFYNSVFKKYRLEGK